MKKSLLRAVFFLAFITFLLGYTLSILAAGDEKPSVTPVSDKKEVVEETKGGVPIYGGAPYGAPVYGGGVIAPKEGEVIIDKMVRNPARGSFVDHLGPTDPKYRTTDIVYFQIKVQNPSGETLDVIVVTDSLPDFVDFMTGPGNFDSETRKMTYKVEGLEPGDTRTFELKARVSHQATLPEEKNVICPVNLVEAVFGNKSDSDESQFCIEKEMEVPQVPEAGADPLMLSGLASALSLGFWLRKKSQKI